MKNRKHSFRMRYAIPRTWLCIIERNIRNDWVKSACKRRKLKWKNREWVRATDLLPLTFLVPIWIFVDCGNRLWSTCWLASSGRPLTIKLRKNNYYPRFMETNTIHAIIQVQFRVCTAPPGNKWRKVLMNTIEIRRLIWNKWNFHSMSKWKRFSHCLH